MAGTGPAPVIIKRKKVVAGDGHHGGAWKVAYADFVTAMMAFFLLMWLLNATTEKQRKGLADHFSPTIPVNRSSGGGDGALGGDSIFTDETLAQNGIGASGTESTTLSLGADPSAEAETLRDIGTLLVGENGDGMLSETELRHVLVRITDEGLVVDVFSRDDAPIFRLEDDAPTPLLLSILDAVADVFALANNDIAVEGHSRSSPVVLAENPVWDRSLQRARVAQDRLEQTLDVERIGRVAGHADRKPATANLMAVRNDRLELILLRSDVDAGRN